MTLLKPARVQLEGVVNRKQATGMVRMMAAESQYRRITVSWTARMEGRLLKRGDLVRITTEEPETWGQSCEVLSFDPSSRRLVLDPPPESAESGNHFVEIRRRDGSPWGPVRVTRGTNDAEAIFSVSEVGGVSLADAVGRTSTQEPAWLAFSPGQPRSFPVLITDGDPDQDGEHIHLSGVIDAAEVYTTTENGVPPLLQIPDLFSSALPVITALIASIARRQASLILTAGWQPAKNAVSYEARVSYDAGASWIGAYEGDRTTFEAVVGGSDQMKVRVRGVTPAGPRGAWSVVDVAAPSLVIGAGTVVMEAIDYAGLTADVRGRIENAIGTAQDALTKALKSLDNDATNAAAIIEERDVRVNAEGALATRIDGVVAKTNENAAAVTSEITARTSADSALASRIDAVVVQAGDALAAVTSEQTARINADGVLATRIDAVAVKADNALAGVSTETTARINADGVLAGQITAVQAQSDRGTAFGRMTLNARSDISGVQARFEVLLAAEVNGAVRGTGMMIDLLPNGSSAVRFDADKFYITAPGASGVPAFSFDAGTGTLRVPNLILTSGQASIPLRVDIGSYTLIAGAGTATAVTDANLNFNYNVTNPDFPALIELFGRITITGPQGTSLLGMRLMIDGVVAAYVMFNEQNVTISSGAGNNTFDFRGSCIRYLGAGNHNIRIRYSYTSPGAGQVQIEELHLAGLQPKA
ncbi:hypothetical protein FHR71_002158 [Methylobacterium sp. RAS18]|nr:hypothetical protein [Methylobacterium sp. RAS18]